MSKYLSKFETTNQKIKNDKQIITSLGGTVMGVYDIPLSEIAYGHRYQPARATGEDTELRRQLVSDIINRGGMLRAPTVTYDPGLGKFTPNDGNHRLQACEEIATTNGIALSDYKVPVAVVEWTYPTGRNEYSHRANNHTPSKAGTKKDAVRFLIEQNKLGRFNGLTPEKMKEKAYELIDLNFSSCCSSTSKSNIWKNFRHSIGVTNVIQYSGPESKKQAIQHWNLTGKKFTSGHCRGGIVYICSVPTAADKAIFRAAVNTVANDSNGTEIRVLCHSNTETRNSVEKERVKILREQAHCNRRLWKNDSISVSEISFLPQIMSGPALEIKQTFEWQLDSTSNEMKWYDIRNRTFLDY